MRPAPGATGARPVAPGGASALGGLRSWSSVRCRIGSRRVVLARARRRGASGRWTNERSPFLGSRDQRRHDSASASRSSRIKFEPLDGQASGMSSRKAIVSLTSSTAVWTMRSQASARLGSSSALNRSNGLVGQLAAALLQGGEPREHVVRERGTVVAA